MTPIIMDKSGELVRSHNTNTQQKNSDVRNKQNPVIIPNKMAYFTPITINPSVVIVETKIISMIKPTM
jgi:hypothetical protein